MVASRFPIEAGHVQRFQRALGADPDLDAPPAVPPTFTVANAEFDPEWWLRPKPGEDWWGSGRAPGTPGTGKGLHAEQHFVYHRMPVVGEVIYGTSRPGATWDKVGRRGKLHFLEEITEWRDDGGELLIEERKIRVITEGPGPTQ